jgi:hypothetical protein
MSFAAAIESFIKSSQSQVILQTSRDGRVTATLPRVGREIVVEGSQFNKDVVVTAVDIAWLCEEARRSIVPAMALLEAGLKALHKLERK